MELSVTNVLQKRVIGCKIAQNLGSLKFFLFIFLQNLMILPEKFDRKSQIGGHWVWTCEMQKKESMIYKLITYTV